jgi:hypothetical protein
MPTPDNTDVDAPQHRQRTFQPGLFRPLSLGISAASGAPLLAGLDVAVVGGIVAGLLSGAPLQVSGPAAGLTVIVAGTVADFGRAATTAIVAMAGVVQLALGVLTIAILLLWPRFVKISLLPGALIAVTVATLNRELLAQGAANTVSGALGGHHRHARVPRSRPGRPGVVRRGSRSTGSATMPCRLALTNSSAAWRHWCDRTWPISRATGSGPSSCSSPAPIPGWCRI